MKFLAAPLVSLVFCLGALGATIQMRGTSPLLFDPIIIVPLPPSPVAKHASASGFPARPWRQALFPYSS